MAAKSVCDVGAGRGSWFGVWRAVGAHQIIATDRSPVAVARLDANITHVADISQAGAASSVGEFDLVAAMYVLLHIIDDDKFAIACRNLAELVRPGGYLLIADPVILGTRRPANPGASHSRARRLEQYSFPRLRLIAVEAASVVANDPVERHGWSEWPERMRWGLTARLGSRLPAIVGPVIATVDPWLAAHTTWMPSSKLALFQRPAWDD